MITIIIIIIIVIYDNRGNKIVIIKNYNKTGIETTAIIST